MRGAIVRLTDAWTEMLRRRSDNTASGAYPQPVSELLGEMAAAGVLMQSGIKFNGALVLQIFGDGPVKLAVAEVQSDLGLRATASLQGDMTEVVEGAGFSASVIRSVMTAAFALARYPYPCKCVATGADAASWLATFPEGRGLSPAAVASALAQLCAAAQ